MKQHEAAYTKCREHEKTCPRKGPKNTFVCEVCSACFPHKSKLDRHKANKHGTQTKPCPVCEKEILVGHNDELYKKHLRNHRPNIKAVRPAAARHNETQKRKIITVAKDLSPTDREKFLRGSNVSERQLQNWTENKDKRRKLNARSSGAGIRKPDQRVITEPMDKALRRVLRVTRGVPPSGHELREDSYAEDNGHRTAVTVDDLTDQIWSDPRFDATFKQQQTNSKRKSFEVTREVVRTRVKRWCKEHGVVFKSTKPSIKNETKVAQRCLGTLEKVEALQAQKDKELAMVSLDETALRVLSLSLKTLCYKGGDCSVDPEQHSKFTMSLVCLYYSTGEVEFIVMNGGGSEEIKWENNDGIWFLTTTTKWMRKHSYKELLNFALSQRAIDCMLDDLAGGHHGTNADNILKQLWPNAVRIRIQGRCTPHIQIADSPWANLRLKKLCTDKMRKARIREVLETGKITYLFENSLTKKGRELVGTFLKEVKEEWNGSKKLTDGVKVAFQRYYKPNSKSKRPTKLRKLLQKANGITEYAPYASKDNKQFGTCAFGCGHVYSSKKDKTKHEKDPNNCFPRRKTLLPPPFLGQTSPEAPIGMLFEMENGELGVVVKKTFETNE